MVIISLWPCFRCLDLASEQHLALDNRLPREPVISTPYAQVVEFNYLICCVVVPDCYHFELPG